MSVLAIIHEFNTLLGAPLEDGGPQAHFDQTVLDLFRADRNCYDEQARQMTLEYIREMGDVDTSCDTAEPEVKKKKKPAAKRVKQV